MTNPPVEFKSKEKNADLYAQYIGTNVAHLNNLVASILVDTYSFFKIYDKLNSKMYTYPPRGDDAINNRLGLTRYEQLVKIMKAAQKLYKSGVTFTASTIFTETGINPAQIIDDYDGMEVVDAFSLFFDNYGQLVESEIAFSVMKWIKEGHTSPEIIVMAEKVRRSSGLHIVGESSDGKAEFEKMLCDSLDGIVYDYPVRPHIERLRAAINHWANDDYIVVIAYTGAGKSFWGLGEILAASRNGVPSTYVNLEMSPQSVYKRAWQLEMGVGFKSNMSGYGDGFIRKSVDTWERVRNMPHKVVNPGNSLHAVLSCIRMDFIERGIKLAVVDYIQLIKIPGSRESRNYELETISRELRALQLELGIPIIALAQAKAEIVKRPDKRAGISDAKDCSGIAQDATVVLCLYRPEYWNITQGEVNGEEIIFPPGYADVLVAKGRDVGTGILECRFDYTKGFYDAPYTTIQEIGNVSHYEDVPY